MGNCCQSPAAVAREDVKTHFPAAHHHQAAGAATKIHHHNGAGHPQLLPPQLLRPSCPHPQLLPPRLRRFPFRAEMKRNRAELAPSKAPEFPAKAQRRYKDSTPKGTARVRAPPLEKPRQGGEDEKRSAAAVAVDSFGGWWWWGAEEEMLLGWFPFVEEDFSSQENMGGSGLFWEEEDYDIWQLQHIHEIPNQTK